MQKGNGTKTYTAADLAARRSRGESRTDLSKVRGKSEAQLERDIADDPDFSDVPDDWAASAEALMPSPKKLLSLRLDREVIDWFKLQGPGYQTRMNSVLRAFVDENAKPGAAKRSSKPR